MEKDTNKQAYQETKLIKNNFDKSNIEMEKEFWKSVKECLIAGDSICTSCLMAIFGELLDIDWKEKLNELLENKGDK